MATELHRIRNNPLHSYHNNCPSLGGMHAVHSSTTQARVRRRTECRVLDNRIRRQGDGIKVFKIYPLVIPRDELFMLYA